ncbi:MAG: tRNA (adenosine(37)-N6)-threonylcarbamoyltransferase complex dimerization subunit type 1 TsaB [Pseudomonadota bacterium]
MTILALNTCLAACDGAIWKDGRVLSAATEDMNRGQDGRLPGFVADLATDAGTDLAEINRFVVVTGPGSFTGIRIGVAFARGLALAFRKPIVGLTSLEAGTTETGDVLVGLPAQKRPPDRTWWVQSLTGGLGIEAVRESSEADLNLIDLIQAKPSAVIAAQKAAALDPAMHLAKPVYARAPDAALPGARSV